MTSNSASLIDPFLRFYLAIFLLVLASAPMQVDAQSYIDKGPLHKVEGGLPWRPLGCIRLAGYWIKFGAFAQSKVIDDPSFEDPPSRDSYFSPPTRPPKAEQISAALQAQAHCTFPDPELVLLSNEMRVNLALFEYEARHTTAQSLGAQPDYSNEDRIRMLRKHGRFTPETVFTSTCQTETTAEFRAAIKQLVPGEAAVVNDLAWVQLLTPNKELHGPGLLFVNENGWKYSGITQSLRGQMLRPSKTIAKIMQGLVTEPLSSDEDYESYNRRCPMPEAPEPRPASFEYEPMWQEGFWSKDQSGDNVFGALERLAVRRLAEDKTYVAATTQLLYAEILLRSLAFEDAPAPGTQIWLSRVEKAQELLQTAIQRGVDARRFSPLIGWLGIRYIVGEPGVKQDMARAKRLLKIAAEYGDYDATGVLASIKSGEIEVCSDHLELPYPAFLPIEKSDPIAAVILKDCVDASREN